MVDTEVGVNYRWDGCSEFCYWVGVCWWKRGGNEKLYYEIVHGEESVLESLVVWEDYKAKKWESSLILFW